MQKKYVNAETLVNYVEELAEKHELKDNFKAAIFSQISKLKEIYGDRIPKSDFLELFGKQYASLKTGYKKIPVDIEEFLLSVEYLGLKNSLRPKVREVLVDIFNNYPEKYEIVASGGLGWGKTFTVFCAFAYQLYDLSCMYDPYIQYNLAPGSAIAFTMQSVNENKIRKKFKEFKGLIENSRYFQNNFPPQTKAKNYAEFPGGILVQPLPATPNSVISENLFSAFLDEVNFYKQIKGSSYQSIDEQYYDQARRIYDTVRSRIQTRFEDPETGKWPGKLYIASSSQHKDDFVEQKKREAKTSDHIYIAEAALWESKDTDKYSGKKFWVQMPNEKEPGKLLDEKPNIVDEDIIEVPIEFRNNFESDLHGSIQDLAGRPIERESKFIPSASLSESNKMYKDYYFDSQIFMVPEVNINEIENVNDLLNTPFIETIDKFGVFHTHIDMSISQDSSGIAVGAAMGSRTIESHTIYDMDKDEYVVENEYTAPLYIIFGLLRITPPDNGEIDLSKIFQLYASLKNHLTNLRSLTGDYVWSTYISQKLKKHMSTSKQSVDKTLEPYTEMKTGLTENRLWIPYHETLKNEVKNLNLNLSSRKVDHAKHGSKDVADAVAGTVYILSKRKATWKKQGMPPTLGEMRSATGEDQKQQKLKRPSSGNRKRGWQKRKNRSRV